MRIENKFIVIIAFILIFLCKLSSKEFIEANMTSSIKNDTLILNVSIFNNSNEPICIPLTEWSANGDYELFLFSISFPLYLINKIVFYNSEIDWNNDMHGSYDYKNRKIPIIKTIDSKDSFNIKIKFPFLDDSLRKYNKDYNICYYIPYSFHAPLCEIEEVLDCYPTRKTVGESYEVVLNKNKGRFEFKYSDECKAPKGMERVLRIGFINSLEAKTTITKEELRKGKE